MNGIDVPAHEKYSIIQATLAQPNNKTTLVELCAIARVSRSGYYAWRANEQQRIKKEAQDHADFLLIKDAYEYRGYQKGARSLHMRLLHRDPPVVMNVKKIRRLMKKNDLYCPIRRLNPYRRLAQALRTSNTADNIVGRQFDSFEPRQCLLTDITYLRYKEQRCYLSTILDVCTHEVLAYQISESLKVDFVIETVDQLVTKYGAVLDNTTIIHSDQGCHYTSNDFINMVKKAEFVQSMSRKGNCWDNAPQESFFGHMKDEIKAEIKKCSSFQEVKRIVDDWIDYYNNDRYQWDLEKLSPREYYNYKVSGQYPLAKRGGQSKSSRGAAPDPEV